MTTVDRREKESRMHRTSTKAGVELSELAYSRIREQLLSGGLKAGDKISEGRLAEKFKISRTPVREAIRRLQVEGLVYQVPRSGTYVSRPSRSRLIETYEIRMAIEGFAAMKAASVITQTGLRELGDCCRRMREAAHRFRDTGRSVMSGDILESFLVADLAFHVLVLKTADNHRAAKLVMDGRIDSMMFGSHTHERTLAHVARVWRLHDRVFKALRRRDGEAARHWMDAHIRGSMQAALALHDKEQAEHAIPRRPAEDLDKTIEAMLRTMRHSI